jgi:hypothetical protein
MTLTMTVRWSFTLLGNPGGVFDQGGTLTIANVHQNDQVGWRIAQERGPTRSPPLSLAGRLLDVRPFCSRERR